MTEKLSPEELRKLEKSMGEPFGFEDIPATSSKEKNDVEAPGTVKPKSKKTAPAKVEMIRIPSEIGISFDGLVFAYNRVYGEKLTKGKYISMLLDRALEEDPELKKAYEKIMKI